MLLAGRRQFVDCRFLLLVDGHACCFIGLQVGHQLVAAFIEVSDALLILLTILGMGGFQGFSLLKNLSLKLVKVFIASDFDLSKYVSIVVGVVGSCLSRSLIKSDVNLPNLLESCFDFDGACLTLLLLVPETFREFLVLSF